ncbi:MAG: VOC family protein [Sphingomonadaceae bacterium]
MIDLQRFHHTGMAVADIDSAMELMGSTLGLRWIPVVHFDPLPFWTPEEGAHEVTVRATYSLGGPHHVELVQGSGAFYDPARAPDARHIGVWVDDVRAEAERLIAGGWRVVAANASPEEGYGAIAYCAPPIPGMLIELISTALKPTIDGWLGE